MKSLLAVTSLGLMCVVLGAVANGASPPTGAAPGGTSPPPPVPPPASRVRLIVHEWGTFTGFAGSDGVHLPFLTTIGLDLPEFVSNRERQATRKDAALRQQLLFVKAGGAAALQRMETPVVYFYTDEPRDVEVRVDFPKGLLTEFYPPVRDMGPRYGLGLGERREIAATTQPADRIWPQTRPAAADAGPSFLDWGRVRLIPGSAGSAGDAGQRPPDVKSAKAYSFARETDSAPVEFTDDTGARHTEKFLFYRGLGNFSLPVTLSAKGGDRFELNNASPTPVGSAFLVHIDGRPGVPARFAQFDKVAGLQEMVLPRAGEGEAELGQAIVRALTAEGLYEKEARAMLATWKANWLGEPGTRVLYVVPRPVTDALLPLRISPAPDEAVRVLVGRIDVLTPEDESRLGSLESLFVSAKPDGADGLSDEDVRYLNDFGRFLSPALDRVGKMHGDPAAAEQSSRLQQAVYRRRSNAK